MRTIRRVVTACVALVVAGAAPAAAASGSAVPVRCGDTVTTSAYLAEDLLCGDGQGITLAGSVTLDLRGHTLAGPGRDGTGVGVTFDSAVHRVTVRGGTIRDWPEAMRSTGEPGGGTSTVRDVTFERNGTALGVYFDAYAVVGSRFAGNDVGILGLYGALAMDRTAFADNRVGVTVATTRTTVKRSWFTGNSTAVYCSESILSVTGTVLRRNDTGIEHWWCSGATIADNRFEENGLAYLADVPSTSDVLTGNTFVGNTTAVLARASMELRRNTFLRNGTGVSAPLEPYGDAMHVLLEGNTFTRNADAVLVETPSTVGGNVAVQNSGRGLHAPLATDLGGNVAWGNGTDPQCVGVVCTG